jgi:hypothetical protein
VFETLLFKKPTEPCHYLGGVKFLRLLHAKIKKLPDGLANWLHRVIHICALLYNVHFYHSPYDHTLVRTLG